METPTRTNRRGSDGSIPATVTRAQKSTDTHVAVYELTSTFKGKDTFSFEGEDSGTRERLF